MHTLPSGRGKTGQFVQLLISIFENIWHGFLSSCVWVFAWLVAFVGSTVLIANLDPEGVPVSVAALALTLTVLSGHFAKLVSYAVGCDTDFRHIFLRDSRRDKEDVKPFRLVASAVFLLAAAVLIIKAMPSSLMVKDIVDPKFAPYSLQFWYVLLPMFMAQIVFSWPDPKEAGDEG